MSCTLIADTREGHVMRHATEFAAVNHRVAQITIGDYAVLGSDGAILAVIERKSLDDYGASLKDGRHGNRHKMMELRTTTGCAVVYIVEGPLCPGLTDRFAGIPYHAIESSIFHLMVRDGITVWRTRDTLDTARTLARFTRSMGSLERLCDKTPTDLTAPPVVAVAPTDLTVAPPVVAAETIAIDALRVKHTKTDHDIAREMWAVFGGITVESADDYIARWSIGDILAGVSRDVIAATKIRGRKISSRVVTALTSVNARVAQRLLVCIPGVSAATALKINDAGPSLSAVLSRGVGGIDIISVAKLGGKPRKVGVALATRICTQFAYTRATVTINPAPTAPTASTESTAPTASTDPAPVEPPIDPLTLDELDALLE